MKPTTAAAATLVPATPVAVGSVVGDLDEKDADDEDRILAPR